jgi:DNA-directed RNA polymerase specialized sigma24 family protein
MSRYEGFTNVQIAEKLSVSIKTVEADITTALKLLRAKLASLNNS